jgi:hypothetical protein
VARHGRRGTPRADGKPNTGRSLTLAAAMTERLDTERGQDLMRQRRTSIEPLFGQIKHRLGPTRQFSAADATRSATSGS